MGSIFSIPPIFSYDIIRKAVWKEEKAIDHPVFDVSFLLDFVGWAPCCVSKTLFYLDFTPAAGEFHGTITFYTT